MNSKFYDNFIKNLKQLTYLLTFWLSYPHSSDAIDSKNQCVCLEHNWIKRKLKVNFVCCCLTLSPRTLSLVF